MLLNDFVCSWNESLCWYKRALAGIISAGEPLLWERIIVCRWLGLDMYFFIFMKRAESKKQHWCPIASENEHESSFYSYSVHECACRILEKVTLPKRFSRPINVPSVLWAWLPFKKCGLAFIIKGSSYSLLLASEVLKCITSGNKADCNFIVQINRETVCPATPKLIHGWAESNFTGWLI